jgi:hypothetical protein
MPVSLNDLIWFVAYDSLYDHLVQAGCEPTHPNSRSFVMPIWKWAELCGGTDAVHNGYDMRCRIQIYGPNTMEMEEL